jgi:hypothetical protein
MATRDQGSTGAAALMAAVEIGVFTAISKGAGTYEEVAQAVDIHPTNAERLMVMLCAAGLVEKVDGRHRNAADVERYLVRERRTRGPLLFGHIVGTRPSIRFSSPDMQTPLPSGFSHEGQSNPRSVAVTVVR